MASLGIHFGGNRCFDRKVILDSRQDNLFNLCSPSYKQSDRSRYSMIRVRAGPRGKRGNSVSAIGQACLEAVGRERRRRGGGNGIGSENAAAAAYEKVDEWMRESVVEIVKNLREAPLLVHVYGRGSADGGARLETEKGVEEENWEGLRRKWEVGSAPFPDGVIFVEELMDDVDVDDNGDGGGNGITKAWGLVVQGKGEESRPACYLLKTSKVNGGSGCGLGMGLGCTHFCLIRVKSFRETAQSQLKNCWLLQAQAQ